jgi:hypothetical protein
MLLNPSLNRSSKSPSGIREISAPVSKPAINFPVEREGNHTSHFYWCNKYLLFLAPLRLLLWYAQSDFPLQTPLMTHTSPPAELHLWRLPQSHSMYTAPKSTRGTFPDGIFLTVPSCHANHSPYFPDNARQRVDSAGCTCAFVVKPPAIFGLLSVDCSVCFDHGSGYLCSAYEYTWLSEYETSVYTRWSVVCSVRFGYAQWISCALAMTVVVRISICFLSHRPSLSAVCSKSWSLPALCLRWGTKVFAVVRKNIITKELKRG